LLLSSTIRACVGGRRLVEILGFRALRALRKPPPGAFNERSGVENAHVIVFTGGEFQPVDAVAVRIAKVPDKRP